MKKPQAVYEYMWKNRLKVNQFADRLHITADFLSKYLGGRANFSMKTARIIERITEGEVTADQVIKENPIEN